MIAQEFVVRPSSGREVDAVIARLRRVGLSSAAIGAVLRTYHGWHLTEDQVRYRVRSLRLAKGVNPSHRRSRVGDVESHGRQR